MKLLHSAALPVELTNGNDGRGSKWFSSAKVRDQVEGLLRLQGHVRTPFPVPVVVKVTRVLGTRQQLWDFDSGLRGNAKEIFDALVCLGWFEDDGPKFIKGVLFDQFVPKKRESPSVIVEVYEWTCIACSGNLTSHSTSTLPAITHLDSTSTSPRPSGSQKRSEVDCSKSETNSGQLSEAKNVTDGFLF